MTGKPENWRCIKLSNRRVALGHFDNGDYAVRFVTLDKEKKGRERAVITDLRLTREGLEALVQLHQSQELAYFTWETTVEKITSNCVCNVTDKA